MKIKTQIWMDDSLRAAAEKKLTAQGFSTFSEWVRWLIIRETGLIESKGE